MKKTTTRTARNAKTLAGEYYTSQEIYDLESARIFQTHWLYAGRLSELKEPGSYILFALDGESVIVVRIKSDDIRGFHNVCRHRGTRLCADDCGTFHRTIQCPYHAWTYDLNGNLVGAPHMDQVDGFQKNDYPLYPVRVAVWDGSIFINLGDNAKSFETVFADLMGRFGKWEPENLEIAHRLVYDIKANWKLVFQNYSECYHCPALHPALNRLTPYRNSWNDIEEGQFLGGPMQMSKGTFSMTMDGQRCAQPLCGIAGDDLTLIYYYTIFPNMLLSLHPDYVLIHRIIRQAVDRSRIVCDWLYHKDVMAKQDFDPSPAVEFWNLTNSQDWQVSELAQKGISSSVYQPGPYSNLESMIAAWDRNYLSAIGHTAASE